MKTSADSKALYLCDKSDRKAQIAYAASGAARRCALDCRSPACLGFFNKDAGDIIPADAYAANNYNKREVMKC